MNLFLVKLYCEKRTEVKQHGKSFSHKLLSNINYIYNCPEYYSNSLGFKIDNLCVLYFRCDSLKILHMIDASKHSDFLSHYKRFPFRWVIWKLQITKNENWKFFWKTVQQKFSSNGFLLHWSTSTTNVKHNMEGRQNSKSKVKVSLTNFFWTQSK